MVMADLPQRADPSIKPPAGLRGFIAWLLRRRPLGAPSHELPDAVAAEHAPKPQIAGTQPGWLRVLDADALLQVVSAQPAIDKIWRCTRLSAPVFERDCLEPLRHYAQFVQLLPASEAHHHAHVGGLLTHTIEMLLAALTWRNGCLLPEGRDIEVIEPQRDQWTLVVFYCALLHDVGKALTDLRVSWRASNLDTLRWMPLAGSLVELAQGRARAEYLVAFTVKAQRDYSAHSKTALLLLQRIASPQALATLARVPMAFEALNRFLSGQDKDSLLARIVRQADKASVQRALASGSRARFATARATPLVDLLMQALKSMLRVGTNLPLNRSGAAGWVYEGALWLVAKRAADETRAWINKHEPDETVPGQAKNDRIFDTWQEYGCLVPNPNTGQAIWYVTVHGKASADEAGQEQGQGQEQGGGTYAHSLSVLRFALDKLYDDSSQYPPPMQGHIEVHDKRKAKPEAEAGDSGDEPEPEAETGEANPRKTQTGVGLKQPKESAPALEVSASGKDKKQGKSAPSMLAVKAPTFNKPKLQLTAQPAQAAAPKPRPEPVEQETGADVGHEHDADGDNDEAVYLLDEDSADPALARREREQRQMARAFKQARKAQPQPAPAPRASIPTPPNQHIEQLLQPVGGAHRLLLQGEPETSARSATDGQEQTQPSVMPRPVILQPRLPRLPGAKQHKAEHPAVASPVALAFIEWLQTALAGRQIKYNETGAPVHFVEHGMALVSPLIFKLYAATQVPEAEIVEQAMHVQREVVKAKWHVAGPNKTNILRYEVIGRNQSVAGHLAAVVLAQPGRYVQPVPPSNRALKLV